MTAILLPPDISTVYIGADGVLHDPDGKCLPERTRGGDFWPVGAMHPARPWCTDCWPKGRCTTWRQVTKRRAFRCGRPTGGGDECAEHFAVSLAADKALEWAS